MTTRSEPTGTIYFSSGKEGDFDIWSVEIKTGNLTQLTHGNSFNDSPVVAPGGKDLIFMRQGPDFVSSLYRMSRDGSDTAELPNTKFAQHPVFHPSGNRILFSKLGNENDGFPICEYDLETKTASIIITLDSLPDRVSYGPGAKSVVYSAPRKDSRKNVLDKSADPSPASANPLQDTDIWEHDFTSNRARVLCSHPARDYTPLYSPDGSYLAFISHRNGPTEVEYSLLLAELYDQKAGSGGKLPSRETIEKLLELEAEAALEVFDTKSETLRTLESTRGITRGYSWSPCGHFIVFPHRDDDQASRLKIVRVADDTLIDFNYDRNALEEEIGANAERHLNRGLLSKLLPDFMEKPVFSYINGPRFFGEERWPHWAAS